MNCPMCGRKMKLIRSEVLPDMNELKLVDGKPTKLSVTLKTMTWRCNHGQPEEQCASTELIQEVSS